MDFDSMSCAEIWDFIQDPANSPIDKASAIGVWNSRCAEEHGGPWPTSGGTQPPPRPPHA